MLRVGVGDGGGAVAAGQYRLPALQTADRPDDGGKQALAVRDGAAPSRPLSRTQGLGAGRG